MKKFLAVLCALMLCCLPAAAETAGEWRKTLDAARGTTVRLIGWGGDPRTNAWLDGWVTERLAALYGIKFERVGMDIDDILNRFKAEKEAGREKGTIDLIWINGENFSAAKKMGLLWGPFSEELPNFVRYVGDHPDGKFDFGTPIEGYESPYGRAQMTFYADTAVMKELPRSAAQLLEAAKAHPGMITYPALPDFTGSAFVRTIICDVQGRDVMNSLPMDPKEAAKILEPTMAYLRELAPYLWRKGESYPASPAQVSNMVADGELAMGMNYTALHAAGRIARGEFPATVRSFVFEKGTVGNTNYLAVPFNSTNREGAKVVADFMLSPEAQISKLEPSVWGSLPVFDPAKLSAEDRAKLEAVDLGEASVPVDELLKRRVPEPPADLIPVVEEVWRAEVLMKVSAGK